MTSLNPPAAATYLPYGKRFRTLFENFCFSVGGWLVALYNNFDMQPCQNNAFVKPMKSTALLPDTMQSEQSEYETRGKSVS